MAMLSVLTTNTKISAILSAMEGNFDDFQPALYPQSVGSLCKRTILNLPPCCLHPELLASLNYKLYFSICISTSTDVEVRLRAVRLMSHT